MPFEQLLAVQSRVNASRALFLAALNDYVEDDGASIIQQFLSPFLAPEPARSNLARELARETTDLITSFSSHRATITQNIALANLSMNSVVLSLTADLIGRTLRTATRPVRDAPDALSQLKALMAGFSAAADTLTTGGSDAADRATKAGELVNKIQKMAANILVLRTVTLRAFQSENLHTSLLDVVARIRKELDDEVKDQLKDER